MKYTKKEKPSQLARRNLKREESETKKEQEERDKEMSKGRGRIKEERGKFLTRR